MWIPDYDRPTAVYVFDGVAYTWSGWYGCQLASFEWRRVPAGTTRTLKFATGADPIDITVFTTKREGLKIRTTWAVNKSGSLDQHSARINQLVIQLQLLTGPITC